MAKRYLEPGVMRSLESCGPKMDRAPALSGRYGLFVVWIYEFEGNGGERPGGKVGP